MELLTAAMEPMLAIQAMKNLHVYVLAVIAVGVVIAALIAAVRSRKRSVGHFERDQGRAT